MFKPGQSGNPKGRKKGVPDRRNTLRAMFQEKAPQLITKCLEMALSGNMDAMKIAMDRCLARVRDDHVQLKLPKDLSKSDSLILVGEDILRRLESGELTPEQARTLLEVLNSYQNNFVVKDLCQKINVLVDKFNGNPNPAV